MVGGSPECMEKVNAADGTLVALDARTRNFIPPTAGAVPVDGGGGRPAFRLPHLEPHAALGEHLFASGAATNATASFGGRSRRRR